ncbi:hypothetical protein G6011_00660 [Alternaria panax]|uniref:Uncharacterized protein n=1 Tax=Alternaria panax TaxID=48097 RepID=A0AAD4IJ99_9PLEO|nr:hypothetical protein G6011_00660 [Alternaria panax]
MVPNPSILYSPADHGAPNSSLPEEVFGHVDLETLANIHRYLCESELQEDIELGTWMWDNYLNGLWNGSSTAEIRTAQAFGKLDRAYRRVRSLTNKAQDKWPFFDRNFKQMSSATVRNNARGEAAPGILYPIDGLQRKLHLAGQPPNGFTTTNPSSLLELQVPFGTTRPNRYQLHMQNHPRPIQQTPVPLPSNLSAKSSEPLDFEKRQVALEQPSSSVVSLQNIPKYTAQDLFSESDGQAKPQSKSPRSDEPQIEGASDQYMSQIELGASLSAPVGSTVSRRSSSKPIGDPEAEALVRDAGAGKVRGPNGRYLPKDDTALGMKKIKKPKKGRKISRSIRNVSKRESSTPRSASEEPQAAPADDEEIFAEVQSPSPPEPSREAEKQHEVQQEASVRPVNSIMTAPPVTVNKQEVGELEVASDSGSIPAYCLAAEAEAVPSNLDRLPPNSRKSNKRRSEPTLPSGDRKRGKHGGIVGRPKKSEQRKGQKSHQGSVSPQQESTIDAKEPPQMITRRATRQSTAADLSTSVSSKPTAKTQTDVPADCSTRSLKKSPKAPLNSGKLSVRDEDEVIGGVQDHAPATRETVSALTLHAIEVSATPSSTLERFSLPPQISDNQRLSVDLDRINSTVPRPASRLQPYQSPYESIPSPPPSASIAKKTTNDGAESIHVPGHVEYFARITTGSGGTIELPIEEGQFESDEVKMIKKYAKYNAEPGATPVSYMQFRQIFALAKQD